MRREQRTDSENISQTKINDSGASLFAQFRCSLPQTRCGLLPPVEVNKNSHRSLVGIVIILNCVLILITVHNRIIIPVIVILSIVILSSHSSHKSGHNNKCQNLVGITGASSVGWAWDTGQCWLSPATVNISAVNCHRQHARPGWSTPVQLQHELKISATKG